MALKVLQNRALDEGATGTQTSSVCEPTAAAHDRQLFMTGNWFACSSTDAGANWTFLDPFTHFPAPAGGGFCCDQVVIYDPTHRIWVWLLQYSQGADGENSFRIAVSRQESFGQWYWWDFSPSGVDPAWRGEWFDYPDMATTDAHLFVTFNLYRGHLWQRAVVLRFPLATLAAAGELHYRTHATTENGSIRLCRGPGSTMYMGSHNTTAQLRVLQWPDNATELSWTDVDVRPWSAGAYAAHGPGGVNWLGRMDPRITGAWMGGGKVGFMWTANRDSTHPMPYIRVVRLLESNLRLIDEPDLWSRVSAWAYPAASGHARGGVGFTAFYGGGTRHPGHVVGVKVEAGWETMITASSTHGPPDQSWGDFLSCNALHGTGAQWVAAGYTLKGGTTRRHIQPRYVRFRD